MRGRTMQENEDGINYQHSVCYFINLLLLLDLRSSMANLYNQSISTQASIMSEDLALDPYLPQRNTFEVLCAQLNQLVTQVKQMNGSIKDLNNRVSQIQRVCIKQHESGLKPFSFGNQTFGEDDKLLEKIEQPKELKLLQQAKMESSQKVHLEVLKAIKERQKVIELQKKLKRPEQAKIEQLKVHRKVQKVTHQIENVRKLQKKLDKANQRNVNYEVKIKQQRTLLLYLHQNNQQLEIEIKWLKMMQKKHGIYIPTVTLDKMDKDLSPQMYRAGQSQSPSHVLKIKHGAKHRQ